MSSKTLGQKGGILQTEVTYFEASEAAKTKGEERTLGQGPQGASSAPFDPKSNSSRPDAATLAVPAACILCNKHHCTCIDPKKKHPPSNPP